MRSDVEAHDPYPPTKKLERRELGEELKQKMAEYKTFIEKELQERYKLKLSCPSSVSNEDFCEALRNTVSSFESALFWIDSN